MMTFDDMFSGLWLSFLLLCSAILGVSLLVRLVFELVSKKHFETKEWIISTILAATGIVGLIWLYNM